MYQIKANKKGYFQLHSVTFSLYPIGHQKILFLAPLFYHWNILVPFQAFFKRPPLQNLLLASHPLQSSSGWVIRGDQSFGLRKKSSHSPSLTAVAAATAAAYIELWVFYFELRAFPRKCLKRVSDPHKIYWKVKCKRDFEKPVMRTNSGTLSRPSRFSPRTWPGFFFGCKKIQQETPWKSGKLHTVE